MSGLGAVLSGAVGSAAGAAGALAAAACFISADDAEAVCCCGLLQAERRIANVMSRNNAGFFTSFMLKLIVIATLESPHRHRGTEKTGFKTRRPPMRAAVPQPQLKVWQLTLPLPPTASGRCRNSSTRARRRRVLPELPAGESWCLPGVPRAWCSSAEPYRSQQHRA